MAQFKSASIPMGTLVVCTVAALLAIMAAVALELPRFGSSSSIVPAADDATPHEAAQHLFTHVMSPYCPGKLLADCTSPAAGELRTEIRSRLEDGEAAAEIENDLYGRFGDDIRAVPPADSPLGRSLRVVPLVVVSLSFGVLAWYLSRRPPGRLPAPDPVGEADADLKRRLEDELERY